MNKFLKRIVDWFDMCDHEIIINDAKFLDFNPRKINGFKYDIYRYVENSYCKKCGKQYSNIRSIGTMKHYTTESFNQYLNDIILKHNKFLP